MFIKLKRKLLKKGKVSDMARRYQALVLAGNNDQYIDYLRQLRNQNPHLSIDNIPKVKYVNKVRDAYGYKNIPLILFGT